MKKIQQHKPEEVKKYNKAFIKFMKPSEEKTGGEETEELTVNESTRQTEVHEND